MTPAHTYLRDVSAQMDASYIDNCVIHACNVAKLLRDAGEAPWIGCIRETVMMGDARVHQALIPLRFAGRKGPAWTAHYVCCSGTLAYDPLVGEPIAIEELAKTIFGRPLPVTRAISEPDLSEMANRGALNERAINAAVRNLNA